MANAQQVIDFLKAVFNAETLLAMPGPNGVIMHADTGFPNEIEAGVVAGHAAILHGVRVGRDTLVGMRATLLSGSVVGPACIIMRMNGLASAAPSLKPTSVVRRSSS